MKNNGITLVELIIVISIIGILVVALGFSFQGWVGGYRVEAQTKEMYVDLMNARVRAMQRNRVHFVTLAATQYIIYEDTNPAPDGNGTLETASDTLILQKNLNPQYPITWNNTAPIAFSTRGLATVLGTIRVTTSDVNPDYDCVVISETRINIGKLDGTNCVAK